MNDLIPVTFNPPTLVRWTCSNCPAEVEGAVELVRLIRDGHDIEGCPGL